VLLAPAEKAGGCMSSLSLPPRTHSIPLYVESLSPSQNTFYTSVCRVSLSLPEHILYLLFLQGRSGAQYHSDAQEQRQERNGSLKR